MPSLGDSQANILIKTEANSGGIDETKGKLEGLKGGLGGLVGAFALGNIASNVFMDATAKLGEAFSAVKDNVKEAAQVQAQLNAVLASTHGAAGVTAEAANKMAESIMKTTPIDKEAALGAENMLLTFTNIHKDAFPAVTKATMDMATAMNGGATPSAEQLRTTAIQVGKALNDPAVGLAKLQKVGVTFTDQQKEQIKTMEAAGNMAGAQKIMTDELAREFGGSATASAKTFQGQIQMLKNEMIDWGAKALEKGEALLAKLLGAMEKFAQSTTFKKTMQDIAKATGDVVTFISLLWQTLTGGDPTIKKGQENFIGIAKALSAAQPAIEDVEKAVSALAKAFVKFEIKMWKKEIGEGVSILKDLWKIIEENRKTIEGIVKGAWKLFEDAVKGLTPSLKALWNTLSSQVKPIFEEIIGTIERLWKALNPALMDALKVIGIIIGVTLYAAIWLAINALRIAISVLGFVVRAITDVVNWVANAVAWFGRMGVDVGHAVGAVASWFGNLPHMIGHVWDDIRNAVKHLIDDLVNFFATLPDRAVKAVGNIGSRIGGDIKGALHSIHIPGFAGGVTNFAGGLAVVGENGPELAYLPQGSNVYPNGTMPAGMAGGGSTSIQNLYVTAPNGATLQSILNSIDQDTINKRRGLAPARGAF